MSLLSKFIINNVVKALEQQFLSHVPELQQAFLNEVSHIVKVITDWIESKMNAKGELPHEETKNSKKDS